MTALMVSSTFASTGLLVSDATGLLVSDAASGKANKTCTQNAPAGKGSKFNFGIIINSAMGIIINSATGIIINSLDGIIINSANRTNTECGIIINS